MTFVPMVVSSLTFVLTLPFLVLYILLAKRSIERIVKNPDKNTKELQEILVLTVLGLIYIVLMLLMLLPITQADDKWPGWLFSWFCAHGWPAFLVSRICRSLWRKHRDVCLKQVHSV